MVRITFNLNDPEGTRKIERVNDEAESLDTYCEILLDGFDKWVNCLGLPSTRKEVTQ